MATKVILRPEPVQQPGQSLEDYKRAVSQWAREVERAVRQVSDEVNALSATSTSTSGGTDDDTISVSTPTTISGLLKGSGGSVAAAVSGTDYVPPSRLVAGHALSADVTLVKGDVGLGNVDNTSDANKPVSTAQQTALNLKANLASPALTGTPTAPTAAAATNTTQIATTAFVEGEIASKAPLASPALTGTPTAPTATGGTNTTQIATTAFVEGEIASKAPLASPALTGTPTAPTAPAATNTTQIATTAFVEGEIASKAPLASPALTGTPTAPTAAAGTNTTQLATTAFVEGERTFALRSSANVALAASTTINITALDIAAAANDVWVLDYFIPATVSGGTVGLKPIFTLPTGATGTMDGEGTVASITGYSYSHSTTPGTAMAVAFMTASFTGFIWVRAVIVLSSTAGTIRIGVATGTSAAGNLLAGASVLAKRV